VLSGKGMLREWTMRVYSIVACYANEEAVRIGNSFTTVLQVITTCNYYTVTHLHSLQSLHANIPFYLSGASGIHFENFETVNR
jgi:hypothetical protein